MSFWWILALVFAFVGGQMLMLRPSKREQAELLLRNTAKKNEYSTAFSATAKMVKNRR